jgi:hypothetical protein
MDLELSHTAGAMRGELFSADQSRLAAAAFESARRL